MGQKIQGGSDERVVLFVKLVDGKTLDDKLLKEIKLRIRNTCVVVAFEEEWERES